MFEKAVILGLYSITPVHAGSGAELSVIDLPIQRERHTGFPVIWGQSLKGVLRRVYEKMDNSTNKVRTEIIFGPPTERAHEHAGAISVGDAKILLFPVRSAKGVFAYVTCPIVLERFKRDLELVGKSNSFEVPSPNPEEAVVSEDTVLKINGRVIIEDLSLSINDEQNVSEIVNVISGISPVSIDRSRIAIVHDDVFSMLVRMATEIVARVRIKAETGTVDTGALWYEEYLPSDTLMFSVIAVMEPRKKVDGLSSADDVVREFKQFDGRFIQIGGNETVGKGFVKLKVIGNENA